ncbi:hypothetical protein QQF64_035954 [Cirrhinus molitorella]|uniref:Uncharacterized protein n=1 Tax=Cirrhinus molitorella TaxID=172907 RepID=A0ABR3NHQ2_9TELE
MNQTDLANTLQTKLMPVYQQKLKSRLQDKYQRISEGMSNHGDSTHAAGGVYCCTPKLATEKEIPQKTTAVSRFRVCILLRILPTQLKEEGSSEDRKTRK